MRHYDLGYRIIHWLTVALLVVMFAVGFYMDDMLPSPEKLRLMSMHKSIGMCVLLITLLRILWRFSHKVPELPAEMTKMQTKLAHIGHGLLYVALIGMPLAGWIHSTAKGYQVVMFTVLPLPNIVPKSELIATISDYAHHLGALAFLALIGGHILAALWHHFIRGDDVLRAMITSKKNSGKA